MLEDGELALFLKFKEMLKQEQSVEPKKKTFNRRARGTGSIYKLSGNRRKPWVASVTIGKNPENGRQIQKTIGCFISQDLAEEALSRYNLGKKGFLPEMEIESANNKIPTFKELWDDYFENTVSNKSNSTQKNYKAAFNNMPDLHHRKINEITIRILQPIFDIEVDNGAGFSKLNTMKIVANKIFTYAMKYDYVDKNYASFIEIKASKDKRYIHTPFTHDEIAMLWNDNTYASHLVLIFMYTGMRPMELIEMKKDDVHLDDGYMIGGVKTESGRRRIIPIHEAIKPFIQDHMNNDGRYLLFRSGKLYEYDKYRQQTFKNLMNKLKMNHSPYDTRHTFATLCNENGLNEYLVKKIMGHKSGDITKDIYTHATIERLIQEVNKLPIIFV